MPEMLIFILSLLTLAAAVAIYFGPSIVAYKRDHPQKVPIIVVNLLLGATILGWAIALAWAASSFERPVRSDHGQGATHG